MRGSNYILGIGFWNHAGDFKYEVDIKNHRIEIQARCVELYHAA